MVLSPRVVVRLDGEFRSTYYLVSSLSQGKWVACDVE